MFYKNKKIPSKFFSEIDHKILSLYFVQIRAQF